MKYKWHVDYVYDGDIERLFGEHRIKITLSKPICFYSKEVIDFYYRHSKRVAANYSQPDKDIYVNEYLQKVNCLMLLDLKKDVNDEQEVEKVMRLLPLIMQDKKLREKKELIKDIKSRRGEGVI